MLNLILGRSGYGKTEYIRNQIKQAVEQDKKVILLVPEQFSFESERALYFLMGAENSIKVDVLSFTRLANVVFREYGGTALQYIGESGKNVLLNLAMEELTDQLDIYKRSISSSGFIKQMIKTVSEFKQANISPEKLKHAVQFVNSSSLKLKAEELSTIYESYNAMLKRGYADEDDDLARALEYIEQEHFFRGATVFIDEFSGLTAIEMKIVQAIIADSEMTYISLCTNRSSNLIEEGPIFSGINKFAIKLIESANQVRTIISSPFKLNEPHRYKNIYLKHLEKNIFSLKKQVLIDKNYNKLSIEASILHSPVNIVRANNIYDEIEFVASCIKTLISSSQNKRDLRYKDIVIIGRNISHYKNAFERTFSRYEVPVFYSINEPVYMKALPSCVGFLLNCAVKNYDNDSLFACLKAGIMPISTEDIAVLEMYAYTWDIKGRLWESEFTQNPRGFSSEFTDKDFAELEIINNLRNYIISPLIKFRENSSLINGLDFTKALYALLEDLQIPATYAKVIENIDNISLKEEYIRIWDMFCDVLDEMGELLKNTSLKLKRFNELLSLMFESLDMGEIPQNIDQVIIGDAGHIRPSSPKVVFIIGANEEVFPLIPSEKSMFTEDELNTLKSLGLELSTSLDEKVADEQFIAYKAITAASEQLYISYPISNIKGKSLYASTLIKDIQTILPNIKEFATDELTFDFNIHNKKTAYYALAKSYYKNSSNKYLLEELLVPDEKYKNKIKELSKISSGIEFKLNNNEIAKQLFGKNIRLSPTQVERFFNCHFAYFIAYGLNLKKRKKAQLSALEIGSIIHYALQVLVQKYRGKGLLELTEDQIKQEVKIILDDYIEENMGGTANKTKRFKYLYTRLTNTLIKLVYQLAKEFAQSQFEPVDFELNVGYNKDVYPMEVLLPEGGKVRVEGIVDRVDIMQKNGEKYLRIVDYKTGSKEFKLSDVYYGLNMQMLLYLFSLWQNGGKRYGNVIPAGVLYMPAKANPINLSRDTDTDTVEKERTKTFRMHGLILDDPQVIKGMDANAAGLFINVSLDKDGNPKKGSSVASLAELGKLRAYTESLLLKLASELHGGNIEAFPIRRSDKTACEFCQYRNICGHEEDERYNDLMTISREDFFEKIENGEL